MVGIGVNKNQTIYVLYKRILVRVLVLVLLCHLLIHVEQYLILDNLTFQMWCVCYYILIAYFVHKLVLILWYLYFIKRWRDGHCDIKDTTASYAIIFCNGVCHVFSIKKDMTLSRNQIKVDFATITCYVG